MSVSEEFAAKYARGVALAEEAGIHSRQADAFVSRAAHKLGIALPPPLYLGFWQGWLLWLGLWLAITIPLNLTFGLFSEIGRTEFIAMAFLWATCLAGYFSFRRISLNLPDWASV